MSKSKKHSSDGLLLSTSKKVFFALSVGVIGSAIAVFLIGNFYVDLFTHRARVFAEAFSPSEVAELKDSSKSNAEVPYKKIREKLASLESIYSETRFVYIMSRDENGVRFLADSEPETSDAHSPRGEAYPDATDELVALFDNKRAFTEGPVHDEYGTWYSSLAPILDSRGNVVAIIGMDVEAIQHIAVVIGVGLIPLLFALAIAIAMIIYDASRRQRLAAFRLQNELISVASHELRTPISGLKWGQETLLKSSLDEPQKKMLSIMYDSTTKLQESIEDILQLASIGSERIGAEGSVVVELTDIIRDTVTTQRLAAEQKNVFVSFDQTWPESIRVHGDAPRLRRVFNNLTSNAIKYARNGTIITLAYELKNDQHTVSIRNEGIGIPPSELSHIFDGFYRASNAKKSSAGGTGMGLFLSRSVIEQHQGKLWLESTENVDTTAFISLPVAPLEPTPAPASPPSLEK